MINLPLFQQSDELVTAARTPTQRFQMWWQLVSRAIQQAFVGIEEVNAKQDQTIGDLSDAVVAIQAVQAAAAAAAA